MALQCSAGNASAGNSKSVCRKRIIKLFQYSRTCVYMVTLEQNNDKMKFSYKNYYIISQDI